MNKRRWYLWIVVVAVLLLVPLVACIVSGLGVINTQRFCDFELYLTDRGMKEEFATALHEFEGEHGLTLRWDWCASCEEGIGPGFKINAGLVHPTPLHYSQHGIVYELPVGSTYVPYSDAFSLRLPNSELRKTEDVLHFINSLQMEIAEFESDPQVEEFLVYFGGERVRIKGTIDDDSIWLTTVPPPTSGTNADPSRSGEIWYSLLEHSVTYYSLPNHRVWKKFPELTTAHRLIDKDNLLADGSLNCSISKENDPYAHTSTSRYTDGSARVDVRLVCGNVGKYGYLRFTLHPDGSYEFELLVD